MNKRDLLGIGGAAALGLALVALPASSARPQKPDDSKIACLQQKIKELQAKLQAEFESRADQKEEYSDAQEPVDSEQTFGVEQDPMQTEGRREIAGDDLNIFIGRDVSVWLDVETLEVNA